ncbi:MAG: tyrosine-type recombinase/integrase [Halioglobus sp.]
MEDLQAYALMSRELMKSGDDTETVQWVLTDHADRLLADDRNSLDDIKDAIEVGLAVNVERALLSEVWKEHKQELEVRGKRNETVKQREQILREFRASTGGDRFIDSYKRAECKQWVITDLMCSGIAPKTAADKVGALHAIFATALDSEYIESNPFSRLSGYTRGSNRGELEEDSSWRNWTAEELATVAATQIGGKHQESVSAMLLIAAFTGMRREEIALARAERLEEHFLFIPEGKTRSSRRQVPLPRFLQPLVQHLASRSEDGYLIPGLSRMGLDNKRGKAMQGPISRLISKAGYKGQIVFHGLRHTYITLLENQPLQRNEIQQIVGHEKQGMSLGTYSGGIERDRLYKLVMDIKYPKEAQRALMKARDELIEPGTQKKTRPDTVT